MRGVKPALGLLFAVVFALAAAYPVAANHRDIDQGFSLPFFPCLAGAPVASVDPSPGPGNDGALAKICFVNWGGPPQGLSWQASTGEWILFRAIVGGHGSGCPRADLSLTAQLDGVPASLDVTCVEAPFGIATSVRLLTHPLAAGTHTAALTVVAATGTFVLTQQVEVVQG